MKLRVSNFNPALSKTELEEIFEEYGRVASVKVFKDPNPGTSKVIAFVEMPKEGEAIRAMNQLNGSDVDGFSLKVEVSTDIINLPKGHAYAPPVVEMYDGEEDLKDDIDDDDDDFLREESGPVTSGEGIDREGIEEEELDLGIDDLDIDDDLDDDMDDDDAEEIDEDEIFGEEEEED